MGWLRKRDGRSVSVWCGLTGACGLRTLCPALCLAAGCGRSGHENRVEESTAAKIEFVNVAWEKGLHKHITSGSKERYLILETVGTGCAFVDADLDGRLDIVLNNAGTIQDGKIILGEGVAYYHQKESGDFEDWSEKAGISFHGWGTGVAVGDIENDGDSDVLLCAYGRNHLYINQGDGTFREEGESWDLAEEEFSTSAVFLDFDNDGFVDLYIANYVELDLTSPPNQGKPCLRRGVQVSCAPTQHNSRADRLYRNVMGERFQDVTELMGTASQRIGGSYGLAVAAFDANTDGWTDIYVANDGAANFLWMNMSGRSFEEAGVARGVALDENGNSQGSMGVDVGDVDGDLDFDIVVSACEQQHAAYYRNLGNGLFEERAGEVGLWKETYLPVKWGLKLIDANNDSDLDLFFANGHIYPQEEQLNSSFLQQPLFFVNTGAGRFLGELESGEGMRHARAHRAVAAGDVDNDGDTDVLVTVLDGRVVLLENRTTGGGNWIRLRLVGRRCNREAIGARVEVLAGDKRWIKEVTRGGSYLSSSDVRLTFGVGRLCKVDRVCVHWPGGGKEDFTVVHVNREYMLEEGSGGVESQGREDAEGASLPGVEPPMKEPDGAGG